MSEDLSLNGEERNKNIGLIVSAIVHLLLTLLCLVNAFNYYDPPPPSVAGILVSFGIPDEEESQSEKLAPSEESKTIPTNSTEKPSESRNPSKTTVKQETSEAESSTTVTKADVVAKPKVNDKPKGPSAEEIALQAERDRIAKAIAEKAKADADKKAELDKSKQKFSDILGKGKGNSNQGGNKGDPDGDPDSKVLDKLSKGSGSIGSGLGNRSVVFEPTINESSQKTGKIVVEICINALGKVTTSKYTQRGSTTTDANLVRIAERAAKKYVFTESATLEQCGNVVIEFKVQ